MSRESIFYTVRDGNLEALIGEDALARDRREVLGSTVEEVSASLAKLNDEGINLNGMASSSVDFGEEDGLPDASIILDDALTAVARAHAKAARASIQKRATEIGLAALKAFPDYDLETPLARKILDCALEAAINEAITATQAFLVERRS